MHFFCFFLDHQNLSKVVTFWSKLVDLVAIRTETQGRIMIYFETQLCFNLLENMIKSNTIIFEEKQGIFIFFNDFDLPDFKAKITFM